MRGANASWIALLGTLLAPSAYAAPCTAPYSADQLLEDFSTVESFLRNGDDAAAGTAAKQMEVKIGCLVDVFPNQAMLMGRAYRAIAGGMYVSGSQERGIVWFRSALAADPTFDYGTEDLPADHPVLVGYIEARKLGAGEPVPVDGRELAPGTHYVDGKKITSPMAQTGIPHVYQWKDGDHVRAWLMEGNNFPPEALVAPVAVAEVDPDDGKKAKEPKAPKPEKQAKVTEPKPAKDPKPEKESAVAAAEPSKDKDPKPAKEAKAKEPKPAISTDGYVTRVRPKEKTPLLIAGSALAAGAGGVFYMAAQSREQFEAAETVSDLNTYEGRTNQLVVASGVILGVGMGAFTWGVMVDSGTTIPTFTVRF